MREGTGEGENVDCVESDEGVSLFLVSGAHRSTFECAYRADINYTPGGQRHEQIITIRMK